MRCLSWLFTLTLCLPVALRADEILPPSLRAGAAAVNIDPPELPVLKNGGFLQATADKITSPLFARALVLESGNVRLGICVVDSCMVPRELCDRAKELAAGSAGLAIDRMLISATHTHSAPAAMRALGCEADPHYPDFLVAKIADSFVQAARQLRPARTGWTVVDAGRYTNNRRWIYLPHKLRTDPFGQTSVRAMMHPGHVNPDTAGPSGPIDPDLTVLSVQDAAGRPLAVLGNFSMHYYGAEGLSSDYTGCVCQLVEQAVSSPGAGAAPFVAILSQGTSGDLHYMDYSIPKEEQPYQGKPDGFDRYCRELAELLRGGVQRIQHRGDVRLAMAETTLTLSRRLPDAARLAWAEKTLAGAGTIPKNQPQVYALEALWIHDHPTAELKLQAIRIGDFGITAIPDEVFSLTGLKLKMRSPLRPIMNIELANGGEGYIPPPEQHGLGGYTTWPARTAGLEVQAEPKIVEEMLKLLEQVSGAPRRTPVDELGMRGRAILDLKPAAWWRMSLHSGDVVPDASGHGKAATLAPGFALFLPGPEGPAFASTERGNRAVQLAGGRLVADSLPLAGDSSVSLWFWNAMPTEARAITGLLVALGNDGAESVQLGITGTAQAPPGSLFLSRAGREAPEEIGKTVIGLRKWHHVTLTRQAEVVRVYLDGELELEASDLTGNPRGASRLTLGGGALVDSRFEGRLDEAAVFPRALTTNECRTLFESSRD